MNWLFTSGRIIDIILGLVAIEAAILLIWRRATGGGISPANLLSNLAAGSFLLLSVRLALAGAWWGWIGLSLLAALLAHVWDLVGRWQR
jgi:hypothetical protein